MQKNYERVQQLFRYCMTAKKDYSDQNSLFFEMSKLDGIPPFLLWKECFKLVQTLLTFVVEYSHLEIHTKWLGSIEFVLLVALCCNRSLLMIGKLCSY